MTKHRSDDSLICRNRRASHRFEILEKLECGLVLEGSEVKSLRARNVSIEESFARIEGGELWLFGCHVGAYAFASGVGHVPTRRRKLLIHRREIRKLKQRVEQKGLTLIPLGMHFNARGMAKVTLGIARGKKLADKRQDMKARDHQREMERAGRRRR